MNKRGEKFGSGKQQTLCWDCRNALGQCSWSQHPNPQPVDGWEEIPTQVKISGKYGHTMQSYCVIRCPLFVPDKK